MNSVNGVDRKNDRLPGIKCPQTRVASCNNYADYLQLDKLLNAQTLLSAQHGSVSYEEHLFIITHQGLELWFKHMIFEMDIVCDTLANNLWANELEMLNIMKRLGRISSIIKLLLEQFAVLETMSPHDFAEFREYLRPASGFQSVQFRMIENKLGLIKENTVSGCKMFSTGCLNGGAKSDKPEPTCSTEPSLFTLVCRWLESTPILNDNVAWDRYQEAADHWLEVSSETIDVENRRKIMDTIFKREEHDRLVDQGNRKFSHQALKGAIMIHAYRNEKEYALANRVLESLVDIDTMFSKWRYNHFVMVQKMIGSHNSGTGGTSGSEYLRSTLSDSYRIFMDLINVPELMIPATYVPRLIKTQSK